MAYERAPFGDNATNVVTEVSQHFGAKTEDSPLGSARTAGMTNEVVIDYDTSKPLYSEVWIPAGAVVTDLNISKATGTVSAATVGAIDISGADGLTANEVDITTAGKVTITGITAGKVVVMYTKLAG